jgi:hypothetical protein
MKYRRFLWGIFIMQIHDTHASASNHERLLHPREELISLKLLIYKNLYRLYDSTRLPFPNTTLIRLRTGTFNLNYYLHKINRVDTPKCQCGFNNETIAHFLLYFPMYRAQRRVLHNNITKIAGRSGSPLNLDVLLDQPNQLWLSSTRSCSHEQLFDLILTTRQRPFLTVSLSERFLI